MTRRALLVLAAATYQLDTILTAQRLGYRVVTTDNVPDNPGHRIADRSWNVDTTDIPAVIELARAEGVNGVMAPCTDVAVITAAAVAQALSLPGVPVESAKILTDKLRFRAFLEAKGIPHPRAYPIRDGIPPEPGMFEGRSWIIKPNRSSGSKGIFILSSEAELACRLPDSLAFSADGGALLEEFIIGSQHTCEGILAEGRIGFHLITDRNTAQPPHVATTGHCVPARLESVARLQLVDMLEGIFRLLDIKNTVFDCDFVASENGQVFIIEMTPRLGGNSLSALVRVSCDLDLVEFAVRQACGETFSAPPMREPKPTANLILGANTAGHLAIDMLQDEALRAEPWVHMLQFDVEPGSFVNAFINGRHRLGEAILTAPNRDELDERIIEFRRRLALRTT